MVDLVNELEMAAASLAQGTGLWPDVNVFPGKASSDKTLPCVICVCDGEGEEEPKLTGNFWIVLRVQYKRHAGLEASAGPPGPDPKPLDVANVATLFSAFQVDNLDGQLNAQGRILTVFPNGWITSAPTRSQDEDGVWVDELAIRIYCCGAVLAP